MIWKINRTNLRFLGKNNDTNMFKISKINNKILFCYVEQHIYSLTFELRFYINDDKFSENDIYELNILISQSEGFLTQNHNRNSIYSGVITPIFVKYLIYYLYFENIKIEQILEKMNDNFYSLFRENSLSRHR
jgi:hypothetical protein